MRLISWNVNGLRACLNKGFLDFCALADADVICLQETKMRPEQASFELEGYQRFWNSADKAGYSGTAVFTRRAPLSVTYDFGGDVHRHEGRVITAEFEDFYLVCCYTPNSKDQLARLDYRMEWEDDIRAYLTELDAQKPVVYCGDLNVAHQEIDLKNPQSNRMNPGFSDEERAKMTQLLSSGFVDTFRALYPDRTGAYSWWSYRFHARENNAGWRIDYFIVSQRLMPRVKNADIWPEITGSDHGPVVLELDDASGKIEREPPSGRLPLLWPRARVGRGVFRDLPFPGPCVLRQVEILLRVPIVHKRFGVIVCRIIPRPHRHKVLRQIGVRPPARLRQLAAGVHGGGTRRLRLVHRDLLHPYADRVRLVRLSLDGAADHLHRIVRRRLEPRVQQSQLIGRKAAERQRGDDGGQQDTQPSAAHVGRGRCGIEKRLLHIPVADLAHGGRESLPIHPSIPLSVRYCFSCRRRRVSRTETFFSVSPVSAAMSRQLSANQ